VTSAPSSVREPPSRASSRRSISPAAMTLGVTEAKTCHSTPTCAAGAVVTASSCRRVLRARWDILVVIAVSGALGSLARWALSEAFAQRGGHIAWSTWSANVSGAFMLGSLMVFVLDVWSTTRYVRPFVGVGVLGGYTTFSTYMLDTRTLLASGHAPAAFGYLFGTLLSGLLAVWAGVWSARACVVTAARLHRRRDERQRTLRQRWTRDHIGSEGNPRTTRRS